VFSRACIALQDRKHASTVSALGRNQSGPQIEYLWQEGVFYLSWGSGMLRFGPDTAPENNGQRTVIGKGAEAIDKLVPLGAITIQRIGIKSNIGNFRIKRTPRRGKGDALLHGKHGSTVGKDNQPNHRGYGQTR
jgi:hypothetical protein